MSVVINGRTLCFGEEISNVVLVAVDSGHASVALEGQLNVFSMRN
jgi:hypothetical protein